MKKNGLFLAFVCQNNSCSLALKPGNVPPNRLIIPIPSFRQLDHPNPIARYVMIAFNLLALGDTGLVDFRVEGYALGNINFTVNQFGRPILLVGVGALATAISLTFFYGMMVLIWRERFGGKPGWFEGLLFGAATRISIAKNLVKKVFASMAGMQLSAH
jgi:hypothetical protein